ncbi:MAG: hypothetical protein H7256_13030 [Bdellovibrio sp.]|nr:hypothetical protein [Bdellovibrio sp.]
MKKQIKLSLSIGLVMSSMTAQATLTPTVDRGDKNVYFNSPNGVQEVCVIPKHYPDAKYDKKDLKKEQELCSYSFYPLSAQDVSDGKEVVALLPKLNSTNPGVNIMEIPAGSSKQAVEASADGAAASKIGKYKNSTSCSYTPSILSYYHVSRILGGIGRVPPSVLRSMDIETHKAIAVKGVAKSPAGQLIQQTWSSLSSSLSAGINSSKKDLLMTDDGRQSYGAFIVNPKHEESYGALFSSGADRAAAFRDKNPVFALVKDRSDLQNIVGHDWTAANVQKLLAMRDTTEFILLDHLLNQQDRFGNIAYQPRIAYIEKDSKNAGQLNLAWAKDKEEYDEAVTQGSAVAGKAPITVRSMILKDNDCGVSKTNVVKAAGLLSQVAHMNPKTYKKLMGFQRSVSANTSFFTSNLMFTSVDYRELVANVNDAARILKANCQSGALKLDLDLDSYLLNGSIAPTTSALCESAE